MKTYEDLDPSQLRFGVPSRSSRGGFAPVTTSGSRAVVQLSRSQEDSLRVPFGLSAPIRDSRTLEVEVGPLLADWVQRLDERLVDTVVRDPSRWFGKQLSESTIRAMHIPILKAGKDGFSPRVRTKLACRAGRGKSSIYVADGTTYKSGSPEHLVKGCSVVLTVTVSNAWVMGSMFGLSLVIQDAMVFSGQKRDATPPFVGLGPMRQV
jgi:hypothetical protein